MLRVCFGGRCKWHSCLISHDVINWNRSLEGKRRGERTQKIILKRDRSWVLEDGWGECLVLFQRTRVSGSLQGQHQHKEAHNCLVLQLKIIRSPLLVSVGTTLTCTACTAQTWLKIKEGQGHLQLTRCSPIRGWCREALRKIQFTEELANLHCSSSKWIIKSCKRREGVVRS